MCFIKPSKLNIASHARRIEKGLRKGKTFISITKKRKSKLEDALWYWITYVTVYPLSDTWKVYKHMKHSILVIQVCSELKSSGISFCATWWKGGKVHIMGLI